MTDRNPIPRIKTDFSPEAVAKRAAEAIRLQQQAHLMRVEALETSGLDVGGFTALYGEQVLDGTNEHSRAILERWTQLYEALASDDPLVAIIHSVRTLESGCTGFGAPANYGSNTRIVVVHDPQEARISFDMSGDKPRAILTGTLAYHGYQPDRWTRTGQTAPLEGATERSVDLVSSEYEQDVQPDFHIAVHSDSYLRLFFKLQRNYHPHEGFSWPKDQAMRWLQVHDGYTAEKARHKSTD